LDKYNASSPQTLQIGNTTHTIPPDTFLAVNFSALQTDPKYWGPDSLSWRPQRWIQIDSSTGKETLRGPPDGAEYFAWSYGPRVCPGKKFSQVEFVAAIAVLLGRYKIEPMVKGTDGDEARRALERIVEDSYFLLAPKIKRARDGGIALVRRS
jgi:cytochrome P450